MPLIARNLIESIQLLARGADVFNQNLLANLQPDPERCADLIEQSLAMCTSLAPVIGYDAAAEIAKTAFSEGKTVREIARARAVLDDATLDQLLDPRSMTSPGVKQK